MIVKLALAACLLSVCVVIHATALTFVFRRVGPLPQIEGAPSWSVILRLIRIAFWLIFAHLVEIVAWAFFYAGFGVFPDLESSLYFSAVTYTTVGYGDLVPPQQWRLLAGVEGLTGILMCGWSTGFFFAVVSRLYGGERR